MNFQHTWSMYGRPIIFHPLSVCGKTYSITEILHSWGRKWVLYKVCPFPMYLWYTMVSKCSKRAFIWFYTIKINTFKVGFSVYLFYPLFRCGLISSPFKVWCRFGCSFSVVCTSISTKSWSHTRTSSSAWSPYSPHYSSGFWSADIYRRLPASSGKQWNRSPTLSSLYSSSSAR